MFKIEDVVKLNDSAKNRTWYNNNYYVIIRIDSDLCELYNLSKYDHINDIIHIDYLESALKEYRKEKLNQLKNVQ